MNPLKFETNDIVRLKKGTNYKVYRADKGTNNIYRIESMSDDAVQLEFIFDTVPYWDIEPLPIDGKSDRYIYLDVVVAATTVSKESEVPIRKIDRKTYYVDALKKITKEDGTTLYDEYKQQDFQYVHEVQHWLRQKVYADLRVDEVTMSLAYIDKTKKKTPEDYMRMAMTVMKESRQEKRDDNAVSPYVGAVLVKPDGDVVTACRGELREGDHAEFTLIERKCPNQDLEGSTLYVTLEPCAPDSRNMPKVGCSKRIVDARIKKIYMGIEDPSPRVAGRGMKFLIDNGVEIKPFPDELQEEIRKINADFIEWAKKQANIAQEEEEVHVQLSKQEEILPRSLFDDLDEELLKKFLFQLNISDDLTNSYSARVLEQAGIVGFVNGEMKPTGWGVLMFGKHPEIPYPHSQVRASIYMDDEKEKVQTFKGALVNLPEQILRWFKDHLDSYSDRSDAARQTVYGYSMKVIREMVNNAILHRDYDIEGACIQITIAKDAIIIKSPGEPVKPITLQQIQSFTAPTYSRNPQLINVFDVFHLAEQRGLGFKTIKELPSHNRPLPVVTYEAPYLVMTLEKEYKGSEENKGLTERKRRALDYIRLNGEVTRSQYEAYMQLNERTARRDLRDLVDMGYLGTKGDSVDKVYFIKNDEAGQ